MFVKCYAFITNMAPGLLQLFFPGSTPAVLTVIEILPLLLDILVSFQLDIAFSELEAAFYVDGKQIGKNHCVDALVLVLLGHGYEHQIDHIRFPFDRFQDMIPSEGEEPPVGLAEPLRQRRHGDSHSDKLILGIHNHAHAVKAQEIEILRNVIIDLSLRERTIAVELVVGLVDEFKKFAAIFVLDFFTRSVFEDTQIIFFL